MPTFAEILIQEREKYEQTPEVIALHSGIPMEEYLALEAGRTPSENALKALCIVFDWNFNEFKKYLISDADRSLYFSKLTAKPAHTSAPKSPTFAPVISSSRNIKQLCDQIKSDADSLNLEAARIVSLQLSLIQQTIYHCLQAD